MIFDSLESLDSSFESREGEPRADGARRQPDWGLAPESEGLPDLARERVKRALDSSESESFESAVDELLCRNFDSQPGRWRETTQQVMRGIIECLKDDEEVDSKIRLASQTTILAVARRWGNVVSAGKATVIASREAASKNGLNSVKAAQQAGLGAIEGVMRVGPVAYPVLRKELGPMVEDFEDFVKDQPSQRHLTPSQEGYLAALPIVESEPEVVVETVEERKPVEPPPSAAAVRKHTAPPPPPKQGMMQKIAGFFKGLFGKR